MHQDDKQRALDTWMHALMKLRFLEHWEYHEIAAAQAIPIGTVQWRVFNAKKKLAPHLAARPDVGRNADMKQVALRNLLEASVFGDQCWVR